MFVRLARYEVPDDRLDEAVQAFEQAARELEGIPGLTSGYVLLDTESGGIVTVTMWESRQAMDSSEVRAARLRQQAVQAVQGSVASVQCLEVAVELSATSTV
jgi:heme-degrading monooxygenase HmoA